MKFEIEPFSLILGWLISTISILGTGLIIGFVK